MTDTKQPKEIFDAAEHFNSLHSHQQKENLTHTPPKKPEWYQRQVDPKKRNKDTELSVWNDYIKPIIKEHRLFWKGKLIEYKFFDDPETFDSKNSTDLYLMQRRMMVLCLGIDFSNTRTIIRGKNEPEPGDDPTNNNYPKLYEGKDDIITYLIDELRGAKREDKRTQILKGIFREFLIEILEDNKLPYFLELLDREMFEKVFPCEAGTNADLAVIIEADHPELQKHDNLFHLCRDNWYVKYNGKSDTLRDSKGIKAIAFLLENQGKNFSPLELEQLAYGKQPEYNKDYSKMSSEQLEKDGLSLDGPYLEDMTQEYKEHLEDAARVQWERSKSRRPKDVEAWESCKKYLDREYGCIPCEKDNELKFIYKKRFKPEANKARLRVSKNIEAAIDKIKANNLELAKYLSDKTRLHTGYSFYYNPDATIDWLIKK